MDNPRPLTLEQLRDATKRLLLKKPSPGAVPDDYEPTQEELEQTFRIPTEQDAE